MNQEKHEKVLAFSGKTGKVLFYILQVLLLFFSVLALYNSLNKDSVTVVDRTLVITLMTTLITVTIVHALLINSKLAILKEKMTPLQKSIDTTREENVKIADTLKSIQDSIALINVNITDIKADTAKQNEEIAALPATLETTVTDKISEELLPSAKKELEELLDNKLALIETRFEKGLEAVRKTHHQYEWRLKQDHQRELQLTQELYNTKTELLRTTFDDDLTVLNDEIECMENHIEYLTDYMDEINHFSSVIHHHKNETYRAIPQILQNSIIPQTGYCNIETICENFSNALTNFLAPQIEEGNKLAIAVKSRFHKGESDDQLSVIYRNPFSQGRENPLYTAEENYVYNRLHETRESLYVDNVRTFHKENSTDGRVLQLYHQAKDNNYNSFLAVPLTLSINSELILFGYIGIDHPQEGFLNQFIEFEKRHHVSIVQEVEHMANLLSLFLTTPLYGAAIGGGN